jgi:pimeloyl-ACP methyl ester carboxylesterase
MNLPVLHDRYANILANIMSEPTDLPALFVRGSLSSYVQDEDWPMISHLFPDAQLATVEHAGHWVHADQPEELLTLIRDFLA